MLTDIERTLEKYFQDHWQESDVAFFLGKPRFDRDIEAVDQTINQPIRDFVLRGGKRLRPLLFLVLLKNFGIDPQKYLDFAFLIELIHNGTLAIDDIEDNSELRRGLPTLHRAFDLDIAVNAGVIMHLLPLRILIEKNFGLDEHQQLRLYKIYSEELINLYFGQATDIYWHKNRPDDVTVERYLEMCRLKTGSLMRVSVRFACVIAKQAKEIEDTLKVFAESAGMAFQIKDDVLDLTAEEEKFGKTTGNDITEGKLSLPVILALQELNHEDGARLSEILQQHTRDEELISEARTLIMKTNAIETAIEQASTLLSEALRQVEKTAPAKNNEWGILKELTESFVKRDH